MRGSDWVWLAALIALPVLGWRACQWRDVRRFAGEGVVAPEAPVQVNGEQAPFRHGDVFITPLATFSARVRVLSARDYRREADGDIVPVDLAVAWGPLSESSLALGMRVGQSNRYFSWQVSGDYPLGKTDIVRHAANMHFVPADASTEATLRRVRRGDVVEFSGMLVDITGGELPWHSSMTRDDDGSYACEVVYVESLRIVQP